MSLTNVEIQERYQNVRRQLALACERAGRNDDDVTLVAVSKAHSVESIRAAYEAGCRDFGESRVQEWRKKHPKLPNDIRWHIIGHLQRNKAKYVAGGVHLIHSVSSAPLVNAIERRATCAQEVLLEVNLADEASKAGVGETELPELARVCANSALVRPVGLMCIPPYSDDPEGSRAYYRRLRELSSLVREQLTRVDDKAASAFIELSMGMTHDFEVAVEEGATLVRVGTAIFGTRPPYPPVREGQ